MKPNLKQIRYDVERLRKASDRLDELHAAYCDALEKIKIAEIGLNVIATRAQAVNAAFPDADMQCIQTRAMDTLRLMK